MNGRRLLYHGYHLVWQSVDLLLPPKCGGCGRPGLRWCPNCQATVQRPLAPLCPICGQSTADGRSPCANCRLQPPRFSQLRSWAIFVEPIRPALHRLKYRRDLGLAEALVPQLAEFARSLHWTVDLFVPVPLSRGRWKQRGYNQAGLISWPLSLALNINHAPGSLRRTRETASQVGLSRPARRQNVRDAFEARPAQVRGRSVLLLDDVATTGATLSSCAEALYAAGARDVLALTVARAPHGRADGLDPSSDDIEPSTNPL